MSIPKVIRPELIAQKMDIHPFTVTRLCREGRIAGAFKMGGVWRIPEKTFLQWIRRGGDVDAHFKKSRPTRRPKKT